jgi:hypothetical protein
MAIYDNTGAGGSPGNLVAATTQVLSPSNPQTFTFPSPPTLTVGGTYWIAQNSDGALNWSATTGAGSVGYSLAYTYAAGAFPSTAAGAASYASNEPTWLQITAGAQNWFLVSEPQQDALTSYIYDNTVGHSDLYNIGPISITPTSTICITTRGLMQKSDAGFRQGAVQMKSGSTTVVSPTLNLSTGFGYAYRTDLTDPNTGAAWTSTAVNAIQIGPTVIS